MTWLIIAGQISGKIQFYVWSLLVALLWSQAAYVREPKEFSNAFARIATFVALWLSVFIFVWGIYWFNENPEMVTNIILGIE
jgi:hypothetical protein